MQSKLLSLKEPTTIERRIWDHYANWADVANSLTAAELKDTITGLKERWIPNSASEALLSVLDETVSGLCKKGVPVVTVLDFGCGLGRNLPLLRGIFHRVVGFDIPEMVERLRSEQSMGAPVQYDGVYSDLATLLRSEEIHVLYDSVVLQHIIDPVYGARLIDQLVSSRTLETIVSLSHLPIPVEPLVCLVGVHRWNTVFSEVDTTSFCGAPHKVIIHRRPSDWRLELRGDVIGLMPEGGQWRPVTLDGSPARRSEEWQAVGLITELASVILVLFQRADATAVWFVDRSGRYLGNSVENLSATARADLRNDLRQELSVRLRQKFSGAGHEFSRDLLDLLSPPGGQEHRHMG